MSKLYLVPTPIGNLEDITVRAIRILKEVDVILAEDTRTSLTLLRHFGIETRMQSFHQHNEHKLVSSIVERIAGGQNIALISDAGTPGISDPGFLIVRECIQQGVEFETLPGATAFVPALINSGLPCDKFCFEGFLPQKKGRSTRFQKLKEEDRTMIFYESPFRLVKTLEQFIPVFGEDRQASVSRELTKMFEETKRGTIKECFNYFSEKKVKGEIVLLIAGKNFKKEDKEDE